jgi:hypothetical protein
MKVRDSDLRIILVRVASPPAIITATTRFLSDHVIFSLSERSTERCLKKNDDGDTTRDFKSNFDDKFSTMTHSHSAASTHPGGIYLLCRHRESIQDFVLSHQN